MIIEFLTLKSLFEPTRNFINPYKPLEESFIPLPQMILKHQTTNKSVLENILLMGGVSTLNGLRQRLFMELDLLAKDDTINWNIIQAQDKYLAYKGLSMMASMSSFESCYITKQEYEESGDSVYVRRFPRVISVADEDEEDYKRTTEENTEREENFKSQEEPKEEQKAVENTKPLVEQEQPKIEKKASTDFDTQMEQLKKLKELLDSGILTQEEFAEKKKKVLGL